VKGNQTVHPETEILRFLREAGTALRVRLAWLRRQGDAGYTTETVVVIALLVALAIAAIAIIAAKVLAKANSLNLG
jgi:hypothetical protein